MGSGLTNQIGAGQLSCPTPVRNFVSARDKISKALIDLNEAIDGAYSAFSPAMVPENKTDKEPTKAFPVSSEFDMFISETQNTIDALAMKIRNMTARSSL